MSQWFYQLLGEEFGPVSEPALHQLLEDGTLAGSDLVRAAHADPSAWIPISQLNFSNVSQADDDAEVLTNLDSLNIDFGGSDSAAAPAAKNSRTAVAEQPARSNLYFYQFSGQVIGPIPLDTLVRMAEAGRLAETDLVRAEEDFLWQAAAEFSELSAAFLLRMPTELPAKETPTAAPAPANTQTPASSSTPDIAATTSTSTSTPQTNPPRPDRPAAKPTKNRGKKKSRASDEKLVENILNEVFADDDEDTEPAEPAKPVRAATQESPSSEPAAPPNQLTQPPTAPPAPAGPRNWSSFTPSAAPSATAMGSPAAAARATLKNTPRKSSSSGPWFPFQFNFEFNGPVKALLGLAVIAALWFGYTPLMKYFKTDEARYISRMELAIETVEKLNPLTELPKFKGQQDLMNREFGAYAALMTEVGSTRQAAKNCLGALNRLLEFSKVDPTNVSLQKKLLDEAKKLIGKYKGE